MVSNRIKTKVVVEWRREDGKSYIKIPIAKGKEENPKHMMEKFLTLFLLREWVNPLDIISFASKWDKRIWIELLNRVDELVELKELKESKKNGFS